MTDALKQAREALLAADLAMAQGGLLACHATRKEIASAIAAADAAIARADAAQPNPRSHLSWAGFNVHGDTPSINEVQRVLHEAGTVPELKATIRALYAAQATPVAGWISVDDSLPPKFTEVLIAFAGQNTLASTGQWTDNHKHDVRGWCYPAENRGCTDGGDDPVVTHWMPLPDVPLTPRCDKPAAPPAPAAQTEPTGARGLIADMLSAMEYHVEQTRPVQSTAWAIEAAREFLKAAPAARLNLMPVIQWLENGCDPKEAAKELRIYQAAQQEPARCPYCDDTGDVNSITGEWRGVCSCPAGDRFRTAQQEPAQADAREALTKDQILDAWCKLPSVYQFVEAFFQGVRFAERAHGIVQAKPAGGAR